MGRLKRRLLFLVLTLLLPASMTINACRKQEEGKSPDAVVKEQEQTEKGKTEAPTIPEELLPGQGDGTSEPTGTKDGGEAKESSDSGKIPADSDDAGPRDTTGHSGEASDHGGESGAKYAKQPSGGGNSGGQDAAEKGKDVIYISFSVDASQAGEYGDTVTYSGTLSLPGGATVYDALEASGMNFVGASYISGIGGLFEKDCGPTSGWKYDVNGTAPGKACNKYVLNDGDSVEWNYVLNS